MAVAAILDFVFGHFSVTNEDSCVKFGTRINIGHMRATVAQNTTFGKFQKISAAAILKVHKRVYLCLLYTSDAADE